MSGERSRSDGEGGFHRGSSCEVCHDKSESKSMGGKGREGRKGRSRTRQTLPRKVLLYIHTPTHTPHPHPHIYIHIHTHMHVMQTVGYVCVRATTTLRRTLTRPRYPMCFRVFVFCCCGTANVTSFLFLSFPYSVLACCVYLSVVNS